MLSPGVIPPQDLDLRHVISLFALYLCRSYGVVQVQSNEAYKKKRAFRG